MDTNEQSELIDNVNIDTKRQLRYLHDMTSRKHNNGIHERIMANIRLLNRTSPGGSLFSPEEELEVALQSLSQFDEDVAEERICTKGTVLLSRNRVIAAYLDSLPDKHTEIIQVTKREDNYLRFLKDKRSELMIDNAEKIATNIDNSLMIRNFFRKYVIHLSAAEVFQEISNQEIDRKQRHKLDRSVRTFLDPDNKNSHGFQKLMKKYLSAQILHDTGNFYEVASLLSRIKDLAPTPDEEIYHSYTRLKNATYEFSWDKILEVLNTVCEHIYEDRPQKDLHYTQQELVRFICNYYFLPDPMTDKKRVSLRVNPKIAMYDMRDRSYRFK